MCVTTLPELYLIKFWIVATLIKSGALLGFICISLISSEIKYLFKLVVILGHTPESIDVQCVCVYVCICVCVCVHLYLYMYVRISLKDIYFFPRMPSLIINQLYTLTIEHMNSIFSYSLLHFLNVFFW